ncbi:hypothetical protein [Butyrivibrio sp. VCD2006]|uniref:hypothetical protein n=1 Tax=Butyrivibrio sp. VCD2006 TaxID=1280664 RepID=UPI000428C531|nr:hypothetical protein [Butyrivibrio sp. VCD2006]
MKKIIALLLAGALVMSTPIMAGATVIRSPRAEEAYQRGKAEGAYQEAQKTNEYLKSEITDLKSQIKDLYQKIYELQNKKVDVNVTVKVKGNGKKKTTVKKTVTTNQGYSPASEPFINTVLKAPGLDNVIPVGQGGKLVIGGTKTRATFVMRETTSGKVDSAKILGAQIGGSVKNVVETYAPGVRFSTAQVDFKVYGAHNGDIYRVFQMVSKGNWQEVQVDEVREGHVICTVNKAGTFAFFKMN